MWVSLPTNLHTQTVLPLYIKGIINLTWTVLYTQIYYKCTKLTFNESHGVEGIFGADANEFSGVQAQKLVLNYLRQIHGVIVHHSWPTAHVRT